MSQVTREEKRRRALEKGKLLWKLVTTTAGVGDLAEPMRRVERNFAHLAKGQQITVVMIAQLFEEGINEINETKQGKGETKTEGEANPEGESRAQGEAKTGGEGKPAGKPEVIEAEYVQPGEVEVIPPGEGPKE